jgi:hypothetical protein
MPPMVAEVRNQAGPRTLDFPESDLADSGRIHPTVPSVP